MKALNFENEGLTPGTLADLDRIQGVVEVVRERLKTFHPELEANMSIGKDEEESTYYVEVKSQRHGLARLTRFDLDLTESPSFREIASITKKVREVGEPPFMAETNGTSIEIPTFSRLVDLIMEHGRKNLSIQRYKGLGEMNADQLWETTMNKENRKLLQVTVDDAVKATEIFSTLMGDQVEPRRDFIERNALNVVNLDY